MYFITGESMPVLKKLHVKGHLKVDPRLSGTHEATVATELMQWIVG